MLASPAAVAPPPWRSLFTGGRAPITIGLVLIEFVAGIQSLVVTAVMPKVVVDLGGISLYGLVFSGYFVVGIVAIPLAGHQSDRVGPARPFLIGCTTFGVGTVLSALAPTMTTLVIARTVQGFGGALFYTVGYSAIAKAYPDAMRARMVALLTTVWVVSGLGGPAFGTLMATTFGWRWAFASVLPLLAISAFAAGPRLATIRGDHDLAGASPTWRWPLLLTVASGVFIATLTTLTWIAIPIAGVAAVAAFVGLDKMMPAGWRVARPGPPALVTVAALLNLGFFGADAFIPLMLTRVRGLSLFVAGVAVTFETLGWCAGGWWQSRQLPTPETVIAYIRNGSLILATGLACAASALAGAPVWLSLGGVVIAGVGMGIAYSAAMVATMDSSAAGREGSAISARFISGRVGVVLATGVAGALVAVGSSSLSGLRLALLGVFVLGIVPALVSAAVAGRCAVRVAIEP